MQIINYQIKFIKSFFNIVIKKRLNSNKVLKVFYLLRQMGLQTS